MVKCFFAKLGVDVPATNRWYTFGEQLVRQVGGVLCHRIFPRVIQRAFSHDSDVGDEGEDPDSFHGHVTRKKKGALDFFSDVLRAAELLGMAAIAVAPVHQSMPLRGNPPAHPSVVAGRGYLESRGLRLAP